MHATRRLLKLQRASGFSLQVRARARRYSHRVCCRTAVLREDSGSKGPGRRAFSPPGAERSGPRPTAHAVGVPGAEHGRQALRRVHVRHA
eukprot:5962002-Prymnesium_polylepis.2